MYKTNLFFLCLCKSDRYMCIRTTSMKLYIILILFSNLYATWLSSFITLYLVHNVFMGSNWNYQNILQWCVFAWSDPIGQFRYMRPVLVGYLIVEIRISLLVYSGVVSTRKISQHIQKIHFLLCSFNNVHYYFYFNYYLLFFIFGLDFENHTSF